MILKMRVGLGGAMMILMRINEIIILNKIL